MAHQALARKYRPRRFADVAAQQHVSETLRRAVAGGRVAHAYLFCGPRGVGKTSLARMLAMALNCPTRGEDGEPCGTCESCTRIWSGHTALDVVEIDAASNRGVDDARDLRERAMYAPSEEGRFKVYIVDEAHMLTREAWNALLKILEEPPPRVIFVFATTEPQKIQQAAAPILSRCQRFDFRRVGVADIVARLGDVLEAEGASASGDALRILARKADGGMRDGLSLLDQVLSLTGGDVDQESVRRILGLVEEERYLELMDIVREGRHGAVFGFVEELLDEGYDLTEFYHGLVDTLRGLLRVSLSGPDEVPELREDLRQAFAERARSFSSGDLVRMLAMASELESTGSLRRSAQPRMLLEMLLLRLSYLDRTVELEDLVRGLGGAPRGAPAGSGAGRGGRGGRGGAAGGGGGGGPVVKEPETERQRETSRESGTSDDTAATAITAATGTTGTTGTTGSTGTTGADGSTRPRLADAWENILGEATLPPGLRPLLRAGRVAWEGEGVVRLRLPPGPALERLEDPAARRALADALEERLDERIRLEVQSSQGNGGNGRITRESVRRDRVRELVAREPLLARAVEELDLELLE